MFDPRIDVGRLSIFGAPLISWNRDRNRVRRLNSKFKRRGCVKLRPRGGLKIISWKRSEDWRGLERVARGEWGSVRVVARRVKLTLNDFSTLPPAPLDDHGRNWFWISMFLIRNIRFSAIFHALETLFLRCWGVRGILLIRGHPPGGGW